MAELKRGLGRRVAGMPGVNAAVRAEAQRRANRIATAAASHRQTGAFIRSIKVQRAQGPHRRFDWMILIKDPHAISINWGHIDSKTGRRVAGIHVIERGMT